MAQSTSMTLQDIHLLHDLAIYNCLHFGPYTQIIYEDQGQVRRYTNIEISREATQLAAGLRALGIEPGDRVIVMMINSPEVVIAYQAITRAGAIIIPALPLLKGTEVHFIAENSGAKAIITSSQLLPLVSSALSTISTMRHIIAVGDIGSVNTSPQIMAYNDVVARGSDQADHYLGNLNGVEVSPEDTAVILYTSGTTGRPKGVILTHRSLVANATSAFNEDQTGVHQDEAHMAVLPLAHAYGIVALNVAYLFGTATVMLPRFDTEAVLSAIERYHIVAFAGVPAMFIALLYSPDADKYDTSSLQYCGSGSAPLPVHILHGFQEKFHCQIREGYGLSEASAVLTRHTLDMLQKPGSVGKPLPGVELLIVDENGRQLPTSEVGEIIARGPNIMKGYYNMPEETANALRNGWLYTGDMGYIDEDDYLYIVERKKDLIIRGGFNVYPRDVEEVLATHPAVVEAAVIGVPSERMGEEVKAFVVTCETVDEETLKTHCREKLANYKTPSQIEFISSLPRNIIGKIDKKELRKRHDN